MNTTDLKPFPSTANLEFVQQEATNFLESFQAGDSVALERFKKYHPSGSTSNAATSLPTLDLSGAQSIIARAYGFETWQRLLEFLEILNQEDSLIPPFETAADAIVNGDEATLKSLLQRNPELIRARSLRAHRATLLHYASANGFENYRQKTPQNIVAITRILLEAGAEVDAEADMYGGGATTLGLAATSVHPFEAGVQNELLAILIDAGADVNGLEGGWSPLISALHNGRPEAARLLAERGAALNLEGAAGVGRLDVVQSFFNENGSLKQSATQRQMQEGFMWACGSGYNDVLEFLLAKGVNMHSKEYTGLTGLHWAIVGNQPHTIQLLLERGASLETENIYGGTALGQALWCIIESDPAIDYLPAIQLLLEAGAAIEPGTLSWLEKQNNPSPTTKVKLAALLRRYGATS